MPRHTEKWAKQSEKEKDKFAKSSLAKYSTALECLSKVGAKLLASHALNPNACLVLKPAT